MKALKLYILFAISGLAMVHAQIIEPVKWTMSSNNLGDGVFELEFKAQIDPGWHLYSHYIEEGGPYPTKFYYEEGVGYALQGDVVESGDRSAGFDEFFKMDVAWFKGSATFKQKVILNSPDVSASVTGELEFMVCTDKECLPPDYVPFAFELKAAVSDEPDKTVDASTENTPPGTETSSVETKPVTTMADDREQALDVPVLPEASNEGIGDQSEVGIGTPILWSYRVIPEENSDELTIEWQAELQEGWHVYSSKISDEGPVPTSFFIDSNDRVLLLGELEESGNRVESFDEFFEMDLIWFKDRAVFSQQITWEDHSNTQFLGSIEYMICNEKECLPPEVINFEIDLQNPNKKIEFGNESTAELPVLGCEGIPSIMCAEEFDQSRVDNDCTGIPPQDKSRNYWIIFLIGFGGGLIALLTPCVFPMIPLTVSFFTKGSATANAKGVRNALIYGISIIVIYVSLGLTVTLGFGPEMLNWIATDPIFNIFFFLIFVFFAFSFFGFYELTLPSSWTNKTDQIASKGGLIGIFFMAFTLALVSFSCTGPIIGSLIVEAVRQGVMGPFFGMLGFAVALALPFTLFAIFPKWLNSLPQSGGWLNSVKVFLGFLELAFALKFFSTADLTKHWGLLKYELFIGIWILIFLLMGLYMIGVFRFPHDTKGSSGWAKKGVGIASVLFSIYLTIGMVQHQPLLGGIAPAPGYSYFNPSDCPEGVNLCYHDYEEGMAYAKANDKPVMLDFTGYGCVNCRLMENNVWSDKDINRLLNEYVIISLYVDDRAELPEDKRYTSTATGKVKEIKKIGKYWHDFQFRHFGTLSQPYYVLLGPNKEILNKPIAFSSKQEYEGFLQCGLDNLEDVCPECSKSIGLP